MKLIDKVIRCTSRSDKFYLYVLGDIHIGARNCAESYVRRLVRRIDKEPNALWIGGGDYINAINSKDKRWNFEELPNWILEGGHMKVRDQLKDIVRQEKSRFVTMVMPIREKCLGLIKGNHEDRVCINQETDIHGEMCGELDVEDLTDCAFIRLRFKRGSGTNSIVVFICHGHGGGRTSGSEPNHLARLMQDKDADIVLRGHSHTFCLHPPVPVLYVPRMGKLPKECNARYKRAGNWGCWTRSYAAGPGTYDSKACYPARSLSTLEIILEPHKHIHEGNAEPGSISMREYVW